MIERVTAVEFVREATQGRTEPIILVCEDNNGDAVELFCKLSVGCDQGVTNLAREVISACLAADLGLPVPKPYFVETSPDFIQMLADQAVGLRFAKSVPIAFGSTRVQNQFSV